MSEQITTNPESAWTVQHRGENSLRLEHEDDGVVVSVEPVYRSSTHGSRGKGAEPRHYRVQLKQDWFGTAVFGDQQTSGSVKQFADAVELSKSFIEQYSQNRRSVNRDHEEIDTDTSVVDENSLVATEAATKSVMDVTGYSDEYLVETLQNVFGDGLKLITHCEGDTIERVFAHENADLDALLWSVGVLIGSHSLTRLSSEDDVYTIVVHAGEHRWFRFISTPTQETIIVLDDDYPLEIASIERVIDEIVTEYYDAEG